MMSRRRAVAGAVLLVWLGMVAWQVRRQYFRPELARLAAAALSLAPGVNFYTLTMGGRSIGLATSRLDTVPGGFEMDDMMDLRLSAVGQTGSAVARTTVRLGPALVMKTFDFTLDSDVGHFEASGVLGPDTTLRVSIKSEGNVQKLSYRMAEPPVFSSVVPVRVAVGNGLEVGETVRLPVFDPTSLSMRTVEVKVLAHDTLVVPDSAVLDKATGRWSPAAYDSVPAWKIAETYGGVRVESWVDQDGRILRSSSPLGFSMEKTTYELARQAEEDQKRAAGPGGDVILATAIQSNVDLHHVEAYRKLSFRLTGVDLSGFQLDGDGQTLHGDTLTVRRVDWDSLHPGYTLPYPHMDLRRYLEPAPLIQSDDPRIIAEANEIAGGRYTPGSHDPKIVARRLAERVYSMLKQKMTFSVPSAVQVLKTRQGDCNEHTVLYVALARALGLPARSAVGLVYLDGSFFYHAWPEVWLGRWVAVDPTFGQVPADASHIRFVIGGLAQQVEIVQLIGNLHIQVLQ